MKTFFVISLISFIALNTVIGQNDTINQLDENGLKQGYWIVKTPEGKKRYEGTFKDNEPIGKMIRYDEYGNKKAEMTFNEHDSAYTKLYYPNNALASEGYYYNKQKTGEWKYYSYYSNNLSAIENFENDLKYGKALTYYEEGGIAEEYNYNNDVKHGAWKQFYENGNLKLTATFVNGVLDGTYTLFYMNRFKYLEGEYKNGKMDGPWYYFTPEGQIEFKAKYKNGQLLNADELETMQQQFFEDVEKNQGKFQDPTLEDLIPR